MDSHGGQANRGSDRSVTELLDELAERFQQLPVDRQQSLLELLDMPGLKEQIREAILATGESINAFAHRAGVDQAQVQRFMTGERDIRLETAEKIVAALGLELREPRKRKTQ